MAYNILFVNKQFY